jgi:GMP synthase-like glutamine amidotransferase
MMKKYFKDFYGSTASIRLNNDGSASLKVKDAYGKNILGKCYSSERAAKIAMGRVGDCWKEVQKQ